MIALLTVRDVAQALRLSEGHVRRLVGQRRIPFIKVGGAVRFLAEAMERWIEQREVRSVSQMLRRGRI